MDHLKENIKIDCQKFTFLEAYWGKGFSCVSQVRLRQTTIYNAVVLLNHEI